MSYNFLFTHCRFCISRAGGSCLRVSNIHEHKGNNNTKRRKKVEKAVSESHFRQVQYTELNYVRYLYMSGKALKHSDFLCYLGITYCDIIGDYTVGSLFKNTGWIYFTILQLLCCYDCANIFESIIVSPSDLLRLTTTKPQQIILVILFFMMVISNIKAK
jgi:hypothetical protein